MSVRKRTWIWNGEPREAWVVTYTGQDGARHLKTFGRKKDADAYQDEVRTAVRAGSHVAPSRSATVGQAAAAWLKASDAAGLERSTVAQYRQHVELHIRPFIGGTKLADVNAAAVRQLEDALRHEGRSPAMTRKVIASLGTLLADAQERGLTAHNAVRDLSRRRHGKSATEKRAKGKLKVGTDIPTVQEVRAILHHADRRWRPLLTVAAMTGLRASELRGLRWSDVDFKAREIHVRQRADRYKEIGSPKSAASERAVPFGALVGSTLKEWKLACPKGRGGLVFPNGAGNVEELGNIIRRGLEPAQVAAGVVSAKGRAKYTGLHSLRHFYASWCINRPEDDGLGLPPKIVQERLGHSSIVMTMDRYGHLFPRGDDGARIDEAERAFME